MKRKNSMLILPVLIVYLIVFYGIWTIWEFWVKSFISNAFENECISQVIKSGVIKNLVWTFPAILLVQHFKSEVHITLKEMFSAAGCSTPQSVKIKSGFT